MFFSADINSNFQYNPCDNSTTTLETDLSAKTIFFSFNPLNVELNPIRHFLALVEACHTVHVSRVRVKASGYLSRRHCGGNGPVGRAKLGLLSWRIWIGRPSDQARNMFLSKLAAKKHLDKMC